ncbi:uncharacterized protein LOC105177647 [Sesamum indicum]|uniref:Uncharacterized protein LOC105177647 n=1 Tax=Sesamum indicum TaxID=4182 RepID=A0A6I9UG62_SESIN|nr:uncharacterized protein LOC105177647 [Sesamum indicum]
MASGSTTCSGLLLSLVIILLVLDYSSASVYEGTIGIKRKWLRSSKAGKDISLDSDAFDGTVAAANVRKFLGGRKRLLLLDEKLIYTSVKNKPAGLEKSLPEPETGRDRIDAQDKDEMLKQKGTQKSEGSTFPSGVDKHQQHLQNSTPINSLNHQAVPKSSGNEKTAAKHDRRSTFKKNDEPEAFLDAADEVATLMRKDYKGADRPRRKPPINNHEPQN